LVRSFRSHVDLICAPNVADEEAEEKAAAGRGSLMTAWRHRAIRIAALMLAMAAGVVPISSVRASEKATSERIAALEQELSVALRRCDGETLRRLWGDGLTFVSPAGRFATRAERLAGLDRCTPGFPGSQNETVDVTEYGKDLAIAIVASLWIGETEGKPFRTRYRATHVWSRHNGQWKLVAAHVSQIKS
jgi:ketosteroid isomerase-like protein